MEARQEFEWKSSKEQIFLFESPIQATDLQTSVKIFLRDIRTAALIMNGTLSGIYIEYASYETTWWCSGGDEVMKNLAYIGCSVHRFSNFLLNIDGVRLLV